MYYTNRKFEWAQEVAETLKIFTLGSFLGTRSIEEVEGEPLHRIIVFPTSELIPKTDQKAVRGILGRMCKIGGCLPGKIRFSYKDVRMRIYMKTRNASVLYGEEES